MCPWIHLASLAELMFSCINLSIQTNKENKDTQVLPWNISGKYKKIRPKSMSLSRLICITVEILPSLAREFEFRASILQVQTSFCLPNLLFHSVNIQQFSLFIPLLPFSQSILQYFAPRQRLQMLQCVKIAWLYIIKY